MSKRKCPCCHRSKVGPIRLWRRNTMYNTEYLNYSVSCIHCIREDDICMHYDWLEYYSSQGYGPSYRQYYERRPNDYVRRNK